MNGKPISSLERKRIQEYRRIGDSLPEIVLKTQRGYGIVWSNYLDFPKERVSIAEVIPAGKKLGKLEYGMCRVRVAKSASYFKLLMSLIERIKVNFKLP